MTAVNTCELNIKFTSFHTGSTVEIIADFISFAGRMLAESIFAGPIISIQLVIWFVRRAIICGNLNNRFKRNHAKVKIFSIRGVRVRIFSIGFVAID